MNPGLLHLRWTAPVSVYIRACLVLFGVRAQCPSFFAVLAELSNVPYHSLSGHKIRALVEAALLGPPSGTKEFALVITLAGCKVPRVTSFCIVHNASLRTRACSCSGSAVPLYLACGAVGRVRCDDSSKSSASSMNVTVPGSSAHTSWRVYDKRSAKKGSSHGQCLAVGLASVSGLGSSMRGTGPVNCWYGYPVSLTFLAVGNSKGVCSSRILRAARMATYMT